MSITFDFAVSEIIRAGKRLDSMHLAPATSGNYSMRLEDGTMAITVSGAHKGQLSPAQVMRADLNGTPIDNKKPSAETLLHAGIYKLFPHVNAILHTHSVASVVLTAHFKDQASLTLEGYELLKIFNNINTHDVRVDVPIVDNSQDMVELSERIEPRLIAKPDIAAYLIRKHGLYAWGETMPRAEYVIEAVETMLQCEMELLKLSH